MANGSELQALFSVSSDVPYARFYRMREPYWVQRERTAIVDAIERPRDSM